MVHLHQSHNCVSGKLAISRSPLARILTAIVTCSAPFAAHAQAVPPAADVATAAGQEPGTAAAPDNRGLDDILVTARRVVERLQDVPLSVTALSEKMIEALDLRDTADVARFTPGLQFTDVNAGRQDRGSSRQLIFRGLNLANNNGVTAGALIFLDGAPVLGGEVPVDADVQRIEVLRGPQNVYFGRSTFSGAVNFVTKPIADEWGGSVETSIASYKNFAVDASIGGPIVAEKLFIRLTGEKSSRGGQYRNSFNPSEKLGARSTDNIAATVFAKPTDWFNAKLYVNYYTNDDGISAAAFLPRRFLNCAANPAAPANINYFCGTLPKAGQFDVWQNTQFPAFYANALFRPVGGDNLNGDSFEDKLGFQRKAWASHLILNIDLPANIALQSLTAFHTDHQTADADNLSQNIALLATPNFRVFTFGFNQKYKDFSQELRLTSDPANRLRWTAGGNYISGKRYQQIVTVTQSGTQPAPTTAPSFTSLSQTKTIGGFAGLYFDVAKPLTLSVEGRYQVDDRLESGTTRPAVALSKKFKSFSPRIAIDYKVTPDLMIYGSYARGTRPGGFNFALLGQPDSVLSQIKAQTGLSNTSYDEEKLDTYEVGVKGALFDQRVRGAISAYYGTLTGQQVNTNVTYLSPTGAPLTVMLASNTGKVRIKGVEAEAAWRIVPALTLGGTFALNDTEVLSYPCTTCVPFIGTNNVNGNQLPLSPKYSGSVTADLDVPLGSSSWAAFFHADYSYRRSMYVDYENLIRTGDINLVNLRAGVSDDQVRVELFVTNAFQNRTLVSADRNTDNAGGAIGFKVGLPEKREVGARIRYTF